MIKHLCLKNHKALKKVYIENINCINVICGKNNSGKTTLLEAIADKEKSSIGKKLSGENLKWFLELINNSSRRYDPRYPTLFNNWASTFFSESKFTNQIIYSDQVNELNDYFNKSLNEDHQFKRFYQNNTHDFKGPLLKFFEKEIKNYSPLLIPPKRRLDFITSINFNDDINPEGRGLVNKLFFLKNQDINSESYKTFLNIYETFEKITNCRFNIIPDINNKLTLCYTANSDWISAESSGLGLSDVLIIITVLNVFDNNIILIEEPENHLHADFQKRLLSYLTKIKNKQLFISTHSSIFLNTDIIDRIFYCQNDTEISVTDQTSKSKIIHDLGYSITENLVSDILILVEGPTDIPVIKEMLKWFKIGNDHNIKFWPLGGDIMASLDLSVFAERKNVFALVDSDNGSKVQRSRFINNCKKHEIHCTKLERYSIENYFTLEAIKKIFPDQIPETLKKLTPAKSVDSQIGFKKDNKSIKSKNHEIVKEMSFEDIANTDLEEFFLKVKEFLNV